MNRATPLAITAVAAMLFIAACGSNSPTPPASAVAAGPASSIGSSSADSSAPPPPSPSAEAVATSPGSGAVRSASPSAVGDTAAAFKAALSEPGFSATVAIRGELDIAAASQGGANAAQPASYAVTGTMEISAPDSHSTVLVRTPGGQPQETIVADGRTYARTGTGPWFVSQSSASSPSQADLASFVRTLSSVEDHGVETKSGQQLHRLTMAAGEVVPPALFGFTTSAVKNPSITLEFWARDDGTPAVMEVKGTWQQTSGAAVSDVSLTIDYEFDGVGQAVTIAAPDTVWTMFASKRFHYSVGHPSDWDVYPSKSAKQGDEFDGPDLAAFDVGRYASHGIKLNTVSRFEANTGLRKFYTHYSLEGVTSTTIAGAPAREVRFHGTANGHKQYVIAIFALKGGYFYEIDIVDAKGHEAADRALAVQVISTFAFR